MQHLLRRHRVVEAFSTDEMVAAMERVWRIRDFRAARGQKKFHAVASHWQAGPIGLSYCAYDAPAEVSFPPADFVRQQIGLAGAAATTAGKQEAQMKQGAAFNFGPESGIRTAFDAGYRQLVLRIDTRALDAKFMTLCGEPGRASIAPVVPVNANNASARILRSLTLLLAAQLDAADTSLPDAVVEEMSDLLIVAFLYSGNAASDLVNCEAPSVAPWQVSRAEQYIDAHWDEAVTTDKLAEAAGCSARALFKTFREAREVSPMVFLRRKRLEKAHHMLSNPAATTTVIAIAARCGFQNAGHFAHHYRKAFGELPSDTLRRSKGALPVRR